LVVWSIDYPFRIPKGLSTKHPWEKLTIDSRKAAVVLFTDLPRRVVFSEAHMHYIGQPRRCVLVPKFIEADG
jgi:hypothetical protein